MPGIDGRPELEDYPLDEFEYDELLATRSFFVASGTSLLPRPCHPIQIEIIEVVIGQVGLPAHRR